MSTMVFECRGDHLRAHLDDVIRVSAQDQGTRLPAGDLGLWAAGDGARFQEVLLTDLSGRPSGRRWPTSRASPSR